eukprot:Phypoly_transcript_11249.p1 GENE.Phypoly_transcript_11249~~Phypoly_transcript_11249.p1  ORF type:complete len:360 (+),score=44.55 Phypoly_transcript_11249:100-1179(+)
MSDNPFEEPSSSHNQRLLNTGGSRSYGGSGGYQPKEVFGDAYIEEGNNEAFKPELQFQTFQHSSQPPSNRGTISSSGGSGGGAIIQPDQSAVVDFEDTSKQPLQGMGGGGEGNPPSGTAPPEVPADTPSSKFWTIQFYRPLFNVDTVQVIQRIFRSLTPFRFGFIETARSNPDFYGPFWIATTLIFVLAIFGNLSKVIDTWFHGHNGVPTPAPADPTASPTAPPKADPTNDLLPNFFMIIVGSCVFYGYTVIIPLILWGIFKYLSVPVKLLEIICIYGYALFIFIPVSLVCVIPIPEMQWALTIFAAGWSGFFLVSNLFVTVKDIALKRGLIIMLGVGALHVALGLTYKLYFFKYALDQ